MTLDELNAMPEPAATRALLECCACERWARAVAAKRPFGSVGELHRVAEDAWWALDATGWLEAFAKHPRIGERGKGWSNAEQAAARSAPDEVLATLASRNQEYERRFGHVFLICATGLTAQEILGELERRIGNEPGDELRIAAGEQARITRLRFDKLITSPP